MGAVAGIELPPGNPGAVESAAGTLGRVASDFGSAGSTVHRAEGGVDAWAGIASFTFRAYCGTHSAAASAGSKACDQASVALRAYGRELADARSRVRDLQRQAQECVDRIDAANARAAIATGRQNAAGQRMERGGTAAAADGGAAMRAAAHEYETAGNDLRQARSDASAASGELDRLRRQADKERDQIREKAVSTAGKVRAALGELPAVNWPAPPPAPVAHHDSGGGWFGKIVHGGLDAAGFIPAAGAIPDLINAGIYAAQGDKENAAWSMGAAVPLVGDGAKAGKMIHGGVEALKATRAGEKVVETVKVGGRVLPAFREGGKTEGILRVGKEDVNLKSGYEGPAKDLPRPRPGMHNNIASHVEAHAAAIMRTQGLKKATLYINRIPCADGRPPGCHLMLPRMLPPGSQLTVHGPDGFKWVYRGLPD